MPDSPTATSRSDALFSTEQPAPPLAQEVLAFFVEGLPVPKGSMRPFTMKRRQPDGTIRLGAGMEPGNAKTLLPWADSVRSAMRQKWGAKPAVQGPVWLRLTFFLPPPKYIRERFARERRKNAIAEVPPHITKPDFDKLERAVCDALTGVVYHDDAQIVSAETTKTYALVSAPGVQITVIR